MPKFTQADVAAIIKEEGIESLTAKTVRVKLEAKLGLEPGALKEHPDKGGDPEKSHAQVARRNQLQAGDGAAGAARRRRAAL